MLMLSNVRVKPLNFKYSHSFFIALFVVFDHSYSRIRFDFRHSSSLCENNSYVTEDSVVTLVPQDFSMNYNSRPPDGWYI